MLLPQTHRIEVEYSIFVMKAMMVMLMEEEQPMGGDSSGVFPLYVRKTYLFHAFRLSHTTS
jgi:hypothetical protein